MKSVYLLSGIVSLAADSSRGISSALDSLGRLKNPPELSDRELCLDARTESGFSATDEGPERSNGSKSSFSNESIAPMLEAVRRSLIRSLLICAGNELVKS